MAKFSPRRAGSPNGPPGLPPAQVRMIKELIDANAHALGRATAAIDRDQFILSQASGDFEEGVRSFLGKAAGEIYRIVKRRRPRSRATGPPTRPRSA